MQADSDKEFYIEDAEREILETLENLQLVEESMEELKSFAIESNRSKDDRVGPCPRGASWSCTECPVLHFVRFNSENIRLICTPYFSTDMRASVYSEAPDKSRYGIFVQDYIVHDFAEQRIITKSELDDAYGKIHVFMSVAAEPHKLI